jgi:hypothetical protein
MKKMRDMSNMDVLKELGNLVAYKYSHWHSCFYGHRTMKIEYERVPEKLRRNWTEEERCRMLVLLRLMMIDSFVIDDVKFTYYKYIIHNRIIELI